MKPRLAAVAAIVFALTACGHKAGSEPGARATAARPAGLDCHGESPVWRLGRGNGYVVSGDRRYGTSKRGKYVCLQDARAQGLREAPAREAAGHRHHRRHRHANPFSI